MFVPILTDVFNHWLNQGAIPGSVTKGVITLLKRGGRYVWEEVHDYRPITLLNTEIKMLARVLVNRLQLVISDLIRPEQNYAVKGRSIQDNLYLVKEVLQAIRDGTEAALINLDQSKALDRVDHRFLATVLETAGFELEFRKWISRIYQVNGKCSGAFAIERSVRPGGPRLLFSMFSLWSPCSVGLRMRRQIRPGKTSFLLPSFGKGIRVRR